jgi:hypothetical protein
MQAWVEARRQNDERRYVAVASENFGVNAYSRSLATGLLKEAETLRREMATKWLGAELKPGEAFTQIQITLSETEDEGRALLCGPGRQLQGANWIFLKTSRHRALGTTLAHEIAHVVMNSQFAQGMPAWIDEGIASSLDDAARLARRRQLLSDAVRAGRVPPVSQILHAQSIEPSDEMAYAVAASLTEFLLARSGERQLLAFAHTAQDRGWEPAIKLYGMDGGTAQLQREWQDWLGAH